VDYIEKDLDEFDEWYRAQVEAFILVYNEYWEQYGKDEYEDPTRL
jgi:hypothetical protein